MRRYLYVRARLFDLDPRADQRVPIFYIDYLTEPFGFFLSKVQFAKCEKIDFTAARAVKIETTQFFFFFFFRFLFFFCFLRVFQMRNV